MKPLPLPRQARGSVPHAFFVGMISLRQRVIDVVNLELTSAVYGFDLPGKGFAPLHTRLLCSAAQEGLPLQHVCHTARESTCETSLPSTM
jgi:hypothetical protein